VIVLAFACPWCEGTNLATTDPARMEAVCLDCDDVIVPMLVIPAEG
jgi:transcription initiation factor TFIIIB Brf1 subunit/transcription initiation factor TFIIB